MLKTNDEKVLIESVESVAAVTNAISEFITYMGTLGGTLGRRDFNDLNKKASQNAITMYGLVSENVPAELYKSISKGMETKIAALIKTIATNALANDLMAARDYITRNLTDLGLNIGHENIGTTLTNISQLGENVEGIKIELNDALLTEATEPRPSRGNRGNQEPVGNIPGNNVRGTSTKGTLESANSVFMSPGSVFTFDVTALNSGKNATKLTVSIMIRVNLIEVSSENLIRAMVDSHETDNFQQYLKYRAKGTSFFRDVVMNIDAINQRIDREFSKNLQDRMLARLITKSRKTNAFSGLMNSELRNFLVFLDTSDVDVLGREYNMILTKGSTLHTMFSNLNMLSMCVVDAAKRKVIMFDSDRPQEMQVFPLDTLANEKRMMEMFSRAFN